MSRQHVGDFREGTQADLPYLGYERLSVEGFSRGRPSGDAGCAAITHQSHIDVQPSFDVEDDIQTIAAALEQHPMIDYSGQDSKLSHEAIVKKTWLRMAQSSVWLTKYQVYLTVSRIVFYDKGVRKWPVISFLRAQVHDANWVELRNYTLDWQGESLTFPKTFDFPVPYIPGGAFYGAEDPRMIVEPGVPDAEPVIVFNMMDNTTASARRMHILRPFTGALHTLSIVNKASSTEKNWMPFFYQPPRDQRIDMQRRESDHFIHFVYHLQPLQILKCSLSSGVCDFVYYEASHTPLHKEDGGVMSGGTNFYPLPRFGPDTMNQHSQSFIGFPRTHIDRSCKDGFYRPELLVLTANAPDSFQVDYASKSLTFGEAAIRNFSSTVGDPCEHGRILILNSIASWEVLDHVLQGSGQQEDVMTVTFSVDDYTTQVMRIRGVRELVEDLQSKKFSYQLSDLNSAEETPAFGTQDVLGCSIEAAIDLAAQEYRRSIGHRMRMGIKDLP